MERILESSLTSGTISAFLAIVVIPFNFENKCMASIQLLRCSRPFTRHAETIESKDQTLHWGKGVV